MKKLLSLAALLLSGLSCQVADKTTEPLLTPLAERLTRLRGDNSWVLVDTIALRFPTYHNQGMVKVGEDYFLSSVNVKRWPKRFGETQQRQVADEGEGTGHLFKFDKNGSLIAEIRLDEGAAYHPGGIDYDGRYIWVPVTKYYPYSYSVVYRVDPETMQAEEVLRIDDSIGAIVRDTDRNALIGANWGAREFLVWPLDEDGRVIDPDRKAAELRIPNPSFYIDAQDCKYLGGGLMFCSGLHGYRQGENTLRLGGFEIVDTRDWRMVRQVPIQLFSPAGALMTNNPCTVEATEMGIRAYFIPEDDRSTLYIYETQTEPVMAADTDDTNA